MLPVEIAQEAHTHCGESTHDFFQHMETSRVYASYLNNSGLAVTPKQVIEAIIKLGGDPEKGQWRGHPHPKLVIDLLGGKNDG